MKTETLQELYNIDFEIFQCCQLLDVTYVYLEEKTINNEECAKIMSLLEIIKNNLKASQNNLSELLTDIHFEKYN